MIKIQRTFDADLVRKVMTRPDIWATVAEDGQNIDDYSPEVEEDCWLEVSDDFLTVGLYNLHPMNGSTLEAHIQMLPEHRLDYARPSGLKFFKWIIDECPAQYHKFIVKIPALYPNVKKFVEEFGLTLEGTITKSHMKNGELVDVWFLGITKDQIKEALA